MDSSLIIFGLIGAGIALLIYFFSGITIVSEWERVALLRFGRLRILTPGFNWADPFFNHIHARYDVNDTVDTLDMDEGSSLQTHDNIPVAFTTVLTTRIAADKVAKFVTAVQDGLGAVQNRALTAVAEVVSASELNDILHQRDAVCAKIVKLLQSRVNDWGIQVVAVELKNIQITDTSIQEAIALEARASKEAKAEMVRAEAQVAISKELTIAAKELDEGGWRLKDLEVLLEMTRSAENNTVLIPTQALTALTNTAPIVSALNRNK